MTQVSGDVFVRLPNGSIGPVVPGAVLEFIKEDLSSTSTATSDSHGHYSISLAEARFYLRATHAAHADYTSAPGFLVATGANQTCNFFLGEPQITTVIVIRHGEKQDPGSLDPNEPLSVDGHNRAQALRRVLFRAGVTTIRTTNTVRAHDTAAPLAEALKLTPIDYISATVAAGEVLQNNRGDVVLIVAHSNTIKEVLIALGATGTIGDVNDFDNMFVVSRAGSTVNVLNLQYGADSPPESARNRIRAKTFLLVGTGTSGSQPERLVHATRGSGVSGIFVSGVPNAMVIPLVMLLGIPPTDYLFIGIRQQIERLLTTHGSETVMVSGTHEDLRAAIHKLGGQQPILYPTDVNHMIVVTVFGSGAVRVLPLSL